MTEAYFMPILWHFSLFCSQALSVQGNMNSVKWTYAIIDICGAS